MAKKAIKGKGVIEKLAPPWGQDHMNLEVWPVDKLLPHPDNPRHVRTDTDNFDDLLASIKANGVLEPLTTRDFVDPDKGLGAARRAMGVEFRQVLSGHRRLVAAALAGYTHVPVRHLGQLGDDIAFDIVAMANLHEELTPLEEGKRAAKWLDRYDQDARAVASKLGKTPHWVVQHAQIYRNLVGDWVEAAESARDEKYGASMRDMLDRWTASHWGVIARLPHAMQLAQLKKFQSGSYCSYDRWSVKELEDRIALEMLDLSKAPFDTGTCVKCLNRTGAQPAFLWADEEDGARGDKDKCLDKKCWDKKRARAEREKLKEAAAEKGLDEAIPLCLLKEPQDYYKARDYRKQLAALKKVHGKKLLTADSVEIVTKGDKDAVPAIVVAGKDKNAVKWVKPRPARKGLKLSGNEIDYARQREQQAAEARRWKIVEDAIVQAIRSMELPDLAVTAVLATTVVEATIWGEEIKELFAQTASKSGVVRAEYVRDRLWQDILDDMKRGLNVEYELLQPFCDLLGIEIDCQKMYDEILAEQTQADPAEARAAKKTANKKAAKKPKKKASKQSKKKTSPGVCRVCGCTDDDCSRCIEKTGVPCYWIAPDLCSACAPITVEETTPARKPRKTSWPLVFSQPRAKKKTAACDGDASTCDVGCTPCGADRKCPE